MTCFRVVFQFYSTDLKSCYNSHRRFSKRDTFNKVNQIQKIAYCIAKSFVGAIKLNLQIFSSLWKHAQFLNRHIELKNQMNIWGYKLQGQSSQFFEENRRNYKTTEYLRMKSVMDSIELRMLKRVDYMREHNILGESHIQS